MKLNELKPVKGSRAKKIRRGRGNASKGTYCGRGMKGQTARAGGRRRPGFEGGQTPLYMRMPKLGGFRNPTRVEYSIVNVGTLNETFKDGDTVDLKALLKKRVLRTNKKPVKILGNGELKIALTVKADKVTKSAEEKITKAKGKIDTPKAEEPVKKAPKKKVEETPKTTD